jgi:hypothetical protein
MTTADGAVIGTTQILNNGDVADRWNIVLLGDGYQTAELSQYAVDAQKFVDILATTPPFDILMPALNVFRVDVTSTESGADDPVACGGTGATAATYFDANFCNDGLQRLLEVTGSIALDVATAQVPKWHLVVVLVNSTEYGGSGGGVAVYSQATSAVDIALHEIGHTAFGLGDEYESLKGCGIDTDKDHAPADEPDKPNVTTVTDRSAIKWADLISVSTPLPTTANPDCTTCDPITGPPAGLPADVVGAFEGALHFHCGLYRPQFDCRMRTVPTPPTPSPPYCAVCNQQIRIKLTKFLPLELSVTGRPTFLLVNDGGGFGPPEDRIDGEAIVAVDTSPGRFFGFTLRNDSTEVTHRAMLDTLRGAFTEGRAVRLDYRRTGLNNGTLLRVAELA